VRLQVVETLAEKYEYEGRPRHKTRPDKYELKVHKTAFREDPHNFEA
jgi:hypothetical protein